MIHQKTEDTEAERKVRRKMSRDLYWQNFRKNRKRVYGSLTHAEYKAFAQRAKAQNRSVWEQIKREAECYHAQEYLPTPEIERQLSALTQILRGTANNLNQMARHANWFKQTLFAKDAMKCLDSMEQAIKDFVKNPKKP